MSDFKTVMLGQIGKVKFSIEREYKFFWWRPWFDGHIQREAFWQDYSNYLWHVSVGWLFWSGEISWQKSRWGWQQTSKEQHDPWFAVWLK